MFTKNSFGFFTNNVKKHSKSTKNNKKSNTKNNKKLVSTKKTKHGLLNIHRKRKIQLNRKKTSQLINYREMIKIDNKTNILKEGIVLKKGLKPKIVHRTWKTKPEKQMLIESTKLSNFLSNKWQIKWYDNNECRDMIKNNFKDFVLNAYDSLIPPAYKSDLWRYCCLYLYGGFYLDSSLRHGNLHYDKIYNNCDMFLVKDANNNNIYQAIFMCKSGEDLFKNAILRICQYHQNKTKRGHCLSVTGPGLLGNIFRELYGKFFSNMYDCIIDNIKFKIGIQRKFIVKYNNMRIVNGKYNGYKNYQQRVNGCHYSVDWRKGRIWK